MRITPASLLAELVLSADRLVTAASDSVPRAGEWPPQVVLGHLAQNDRENWAQRIALMVNAERAGAPSPTFTWFEPPADQVEQRYGSLSVAQAASDLMASRISLVGQLRELGPGDWEATAVHDTFGELDVAGLLLRLLGHDEEHRAGLLHVSLDGTLGV